jgi:hypothetical protein
LGLETLSEGRLGRTPASRPELFRNGPANTLLALARI